MTYKNVDPKEIDKFAELAGEWWDRNGKCKPLHDINPLRMSFIQHRANLSNQHVIDVGCGGGILSESLAAQGAVVTGIDMNSAALNVAIKHAEESGLTIDYQKTTAEEFAKQHPAKFDIVTCMELLEHVPDPKSVISACAQFVKPGGHVFFSTLNRNIKSFLLAVVGAEYILNMLPKGTHEYKKFIRPAELESWSRGEGLCLKKLSGIHYNPLSKHYRLANDISVNYLAYFQHDK